MALTHSAADALAREGIAALRAGQGRRAVERLEQLHAAPPDFPAPWFPLAQAYRLTGNAAAEERALEQHLSREPTHLPALLMMGEVKARKSDDRAAAAHYQAALALARQQDTVAPALQPMIQQALAFVEAAEARFASHLNQSLAEDGLSDGRGGARLRHAIDLLLGRSTLYLQQPLAFYFPGLPQRYFYEREEFPWLSGLEAETPAIAVEAAALLAREGEAFAPYVVTPPDRPPPANPLRDDPSWGAYYLWRSGELQPDAIARTPDTIAALEKAPLPVVAERSPMALFSLLKPGTHIKPHHGLLNTRLICHLPLIAPDGCALRVGADVRQWCQGEALIFDDSIEHEAWNRGTSTRVVLLFEIWRPELSTEERAALTRIFETINAYQGMPVDAG